MSLETAQHSFLWGGRKGAVEFSNFSVNGVRVDEICEVHCQAAFSNSDAVDAFYFRNVSREPRAGTVARLGSGSERSSTLSFAPIQQATVFTCFDTFWEHSKVKQESKLRSDNCEGLFVWSLLNMETPNVMGS